MVFGPYPAELSDERVMSTSFLGVRILNRRWPVAAPAPPGIGEGAHGQVLRVQESGVCVVAGVAPNPVWHTAWTKDATCRSLDVVSALSKWRLT